MPGNTFVLLIVHSHQMSIMAAYFVNWKKTPVTILNKIAFQLKWFKFITDFSLKKQYTESETYYIHYYVNIEQDLLHLFSVIVLLEGLFATLSYSMAFGIYRVGGQSTWWEPLISARKTCIFLGFKMFFYFCLTRQIDINSTRNGCLLTMYYFV